MTNRTQQAQNRSWKRNRCDGILKKIDMVKGNQNSLLLFLLFGFSIISFASTSSEFKITEHTERRVQTTKNANRTRDLRKYNRAIRFRKIRRIDEHRTRFVSILPFGVPAVSFYPVWLPPVPGVFSPAAGVSFRFRSPVFLVPAASS